MRAVSIIIKRAALLSLCLVPLVRGQAVPPPGTEESPAITVSDPYRVQWYPQTFQTSGPVPVWMNGYLVRPVNRVVSGEVNVPLYDARGNLGTQGRITYPGASEIILTDAAVTPNGIILGAGMANTKETVAVFVARTERNGEEVERVELGDFWPLRICGSNENEVWVLGRAMTDDQMPNADYPMLREYVFGQGLIRGVLPRNSVALQPNGIAAGPGSHGNYLDCKKDRVRLYITQTNEYVEINENSAEILRWKMDMSAFPDGSVTGFAVTDDGRVFASIYFDMGDEQQTIQRGLYEIKTITGNPIGRWLAVRGTASANPLQGSAPQWTFWKLWGADGKNLVANLAKSGDLAWIKVLN